MIDWRDAQWHRDFEAALTELEGRTVAKALPVQLERRLLAVLPVRHEPRPQEQFNVQSEKQVLGELDIDSLGAVELRYEILRRTTVRKTGNPNLREVRYLGEAVGQIARSPWVFNTWIASSDRRIPCSSIADASVLVVLDSLRNGGAA